MMKGIKAKIAGPENSANDIIREMSNIRKHIDVIDSSCDKLRKNLDRDVDDQNFRLSLSNFENAMNEGSPSLGGIQRFADRLKTASELRHRQAGSALAVWKQESSEAKEHLDNFERYVDERIVRIETELSAIGSSLSKFRDAILGREKAWHWALDRAAIIGFFILAMTIAGMRLAIPEPLDRVVGSFQAEQAPSIANQPLVEPTEVAPQDLPKVTNDVE